jgi:hypothetical protein
MKDLFYFGYINHTLRSKDIKNIFTRQTIIRDVKQSVISYNKSWILPCQGTFIIVKKLQNKNFNHDNRILVVL